MNKEEPTLGSDKIASEIETTPKAKTVLASREVVVKNEIGLYARPATYFIQKANEFKSLVWVEKDERRVNAKSLLGILSLGIVGGTSIKIIADGADEEVAVEALVDLVTNGFSEQA